MCHDYTMSLTIPQTVLGGTQWDPLVLTTSKGQDRRVHKCRCTNSTCVPLNCTPYLTTVRTTYMSQHLRSCSIISLLWTKGLLPRDSLLLPSYIIHRMYSLMRYPFLTNQLKFKVRESICNISYSDNRLEV